MQRAAWALRFRMNGQSPFHVSSDVTSCFRAPNGSVACFPLSPSSSATVLLRPRFSARKIKRESRFTRDDDSIRSESEVETIIINRRFPLIRIHYCTFCRLALSSLLLVLSSSPLLSPVLTPRHWSAARCTRNKERNRSAYRSPRLFIAITILPVHMHAQ
jgi:hypothetical protein